MLSAARGSEGVTRTPAAADVDRVRWAVVADDSVASRKLIGAVLRRGGFGVHEAADGAAAWQLVEEQAPDLLVVDDLPWPRGKCRCGAERGSSPRHPDLE